MELSLEGLIALPISIQQNPQTQVLWGDDTGYRKMRTLDVNPAPLVEPDILMRPAYEGVSPYSGEAPSAVGWAGVSQAGSSCSEKRRQDQSTWPIRRCEESAQTT